MTKERILKSSNECKKKIDEYLQCWNIEQERYPSDKFIDIDHECSKVYAHLSFMIEQIPKFLTDEKIEKSMRWLGFIQGVLWVYSEFTIDDLKNQNKSISNID